jgi:hypothetical protein
METVDSKDSSGSVVRPSSASDTPGAIRSTVPLRTGSGVGTLKTPGRTVAIWVGESLVMIVAMTLPPSAGRVCLRIPTSEMVPLA